MSIARKTVEFARMSFMDRRRGRTAFYTRRRNPMRFAIGDNGGSFSARIGTPRFASPMNAPGFLRIYLCFAAAYLLSYVFRNVNAVISPELTDTLGINASSLGLLTSAYFVAFASMQIPAGMLLDRYGPRRVEPVFLGVAGCGALAFAASDGIAGLAFSRALIGAGVSVCLMAPLKAIATW